MFKKISVKVAVLVNLILLVVIAGGTFFLIQQQSVSLEKQYAAHGKFLSLMGAKAISRLMEEAVDNGVFPIKDALDTDYSPIPNFDPPKYHTKYDFYTDKAFLTLQDEFLKNPDLLYAVAMDINGYIPTHDTKYQKPITGDKAKDLADNRTKRIFNDPLNLKAAKNMEEGLIQEYKRDTGETAWDFASPIYVKGKLWGNFRIGIALDTLNAAKKDLMIKLISIMLGILLLATFAVYLIVNATLKPLTQFTKIASRMADGDVEEKIVSTSHDEIGELADVLERMRISMKTAMDRLSK